MSEESKKNLGSSDIQSVTAEEASSENSNERYTEEQRKTMRDKVLGWLKSHPETETKPADNAVIVPKQRKGSKFKWPWSHAKKTTKAHFKPVHKIESPTPLPPKIDREIEDSVVEKDSMAEQPDSKPPTQGISKTENEASWPPTVVEGEGVPEANNTISPSAKQESKPATKDFAYPEIAPTHDALLTEGHDLISEDEHAKIVEKIEEAKIIPKSISDSKNTTNSNLVPETTSASKSLSFKQNRPAISLPNTYKTAWLLFIVITVVGIFSPTFGWGSVFSKVTPTPYAVIGHTVIMRSTFDREVMALQQFQTQQPSLKLTDEQLKQQVETAIIRRTIASEIAEEEGVWISQKEVDEELAKITTNAGSIEQVQNTVKTLWGWSLSEYERYIIRPSLTKKALQLKLSEDPILQREIGQAGDITQFDRYLDSLRPSYRIIVF